MSSLKLFDSIIFDAIEKEKQRQIDNLELIPSENYVSRPVLEALGSILTNKYSEGYCGNRYYGGCENIDIIEATAIERAKALFNAEHVNVQPLSGAPANIAVYFALLNPGDTILGMDLSHGGHLTHGHPVTHMSKVFNFVRYKTVKESGLIDYDEIEEMAKSHKPKIILVGYSAYSREIDYARIKEIANKYNAITMADIAHIAGLIAGKQMNNPVPLFDIVTTTTHKTLRGPRGGMIMCKNEFAKAIDKSVFPGFQGGPHENNIAAKAIAFKEALSPEFQEYSKQIILNAKRLEIELKNLGYGIMFKQTDNHLLLIDITSKNIGGKEAQISLDLAGITANKNMIPDDTRSPFDPSGIRIGTPAITTRGMKEEQMPKIANWINQALENSKDPTKLEIIKKEIAEFSKDFPVPGIND